MDMKVCKYFVNELSVQSKYKNSRNNFMKIWT